MIDKIRPRRSALYMPASNERALEKARTLGVDAVIFDLEDAVAPGAIQTESELEEFPDQEAMARTMAERQCLPQRIRPEDLVGTFVFLASDDSDPITGQTIVVDGGWALH